MNNPDTLDTTIERLIELLDLESIEENIFRGESQDIGSPQVFGGQVLGQALTAASQTVKNRNVHSLHAYFLRRGDFKAPIGWVGNFWFFFGFTVEYFHRFSFIC